MRAMQQTLQSDRPERRPPTAWEQIRNDVQAGLLACLPEHVQRLAWNAQQVNHAQRDALRQLLAHAIERSPYHRRHLAGVDPDRIDPRDLTALPIMTKAEMMAELGDVFTDPRLSRAQVEQALAKTDAEPVPILDQYIAHASGGSSGQRGIFVYERRGLTGYSLSLARPLAARLHATGGPPPGGLRIAMLAAASAIHPTGAASAQTAGPRPMPFRFLPVPVTLPLPEIVQRLNDNQPHGLFGYPSTLASLAAEQRAGRLRISPRAINCTGETLTPHTRAAITDAFNTPVIDSFASTEGLTGTSAPDESILQFNSDMCIAEPVDEHNQPVPPGHPSHKVLITNLYNLAQPLIRYQLDDIFTAEPPTPQRGHLRARVQGRADEPLHYPQLDIHPHVIRSVLLQTPQLVDYQIHQTPHGIDIQAIAPPATDLQGITERLARALTDAGFENPKVTVQLVDELQRHPQTGKVKRFVALPSTTGYPTSNAT